MEINGFWGTHVLAAIGTGLIECDFVAELDDDIILVVEYRGAHLASNPDTMEKKSVGLLWERSCAGKGKFLLALKDDNGLGMQEQLAEKIS